MSAEREALRSALKAFPPCDFCAQPSTWFERGNAPGRGPYLDRVHYRCSEHCPGTPGWRPTQHRVAVQTIQDLLSQPEPAAPDVEALARVAFETYADSVTTKRHVTWEQLWEKNQGGWAAVVRAILAAIGPIRREEPKEASATVWVVHGTVVPALQAAFGNEDAAMRWAKQYAGFAKITAATLHASPCDCSSECRTFPDLGVLCAAGRRAQRNASQAQGHDAVQRLDNAANPHPRR